MFVLPRLITVIFMAVLPFLPPAYAQAPAVTAITQGTEAPKPADAPKDALGRDTPQGMMNGFLDAVAREDYQRAADYLELTNLPRAMRKTPGPELAKNLQYILDQSGVSIRTRLLSLDPEGDRNDGMAENLERVGRVKTPEKIVDLLAARMDADAGERANLWLISTLTVAQIPSLLDDVKVSPINSVLPEYLTEHKFLGIPWGHWLTLLVLAPAAYGLSFSIITMILFTVRRTRRLFKKDEAIPLLSAFAAPLTLFFAVIIFIIASRYLGVSIVARRYFGRGAAVIGWIALAWLFLGVIDVFTGAARTRLQRRGQIDAISILVFIRRSLKMAIIAIAVMLALNVLGVDVTAGLAAFGIGGIAIALGAQKTVENLVGSLSLIADRPIRIGDFCKIGDVQGTIEDIGMRSTRVRTQDRTIITIPNGQLSTLQIDNQNRKDFFVFRPVLAIRQDTTPDQMRYLLVELRALLYAHARIDNTAANVRFTGITENTLKVEITGRVIAKNGDEFTEIQEDLLLRVMDIVAKSGTNLAHPTRLVYLARAPKNDDEKRGAAERNVQAAAAQGTLGLPKFDPARIQQLKNNIDYPPKGTFLRGQQDKKK